MEQAKVKNSIDNYAMKQAEEIREITEIGLNEKEKVIKQAIDHFEIEMKDFLNRVDIKSGLKDEKLYVDGNLIAEFKVDFDLHNMKATTTSMKYF